MRFTPKTTLPLEDLRTQALLDCLEEIVNLHDNAMLCTTRVILEGHIVLLQAEIEVRERTDKAWADHQSNEFALAR